LVDLPGYGFAYAKEEIKDAWDDLVSVLICILHLWNFVVDYGLL
jgi:GTP-binding protein EngB required for normal cell division